MSYTHTHTLTHTSMCLSVCGSNFSLRTRKKTKHNLHATLGAPSKEGRVKSLPNTLSGLLHLPLDFACINEANKLCF